MKIRKICNNCGSANVVTDAWACWDEDAQEWVLDEVFEYEYCCNCEQDISIANVPLEVTAKEDGDDDPDT